MNIIYWIYRSSHRVARPDTYLCAYFAETCGTVFQVRASSEPPCTPERECLPLHASVSAYHLYLSALTILVGIE